MVEGLYTGDPDVMNAMHDLSHLQLSTATEDSLAWQTNLCDASTSFNLEHPDSQWVLGGLCREVC